METISIVCIVIAVICLILIWFISIYNRFQANIIRINEVEADIDNVLRKRFDLLNKSIAIMKKNLPEEEPLKIIEELHSKKMSNFELDRALYQAINEFDIYKDQINSYKNEAFIPMNEEYLYKRAVQISDERDREAKVIKKVIAKTIRK